MRRLLALLLAALVLLGAAPVPARAEDAVRELATAEDFLAFARSCARESYSRAQRFALTADIDLTGLDYEPAAYFAGRFDGRGHTVRGLSLTGEGSRVGLFRTVGEGAAVENLHVEGRVSPGGTREYVGGLAGVNEGEVRACSFGGEVSGGNAVGGLVGQNRGVVSGCAVSGSVLGEHRVGGLVGENAGRVADCVSDSAVNTVPVTPSGEPRFDLAAFSQDDFVDLSDIGGVAGENSGTLQRCTNRGAVGYPYLGYNVGGVAGLSRGFVDGCANGGAVQGRRDVGGLVGQLIPYAAWQFSNEKLEELREAIGYMHHLLNTANRNLDERGETLRTQLGSMTGYTDQALRAIAAMLDALLEGEKTIAGGIRLDGDSLEILVPQFDGNLPDTGDLTSAIYNLYARSTQLGDLLGGGLFGAAEDLKNISNQMGYILNLLFDLADTQPAELVTTRDLSLAEAYAHDEGAVARSLNRGSVLAETNAGGAVGTVAFEIEFDSEDRLNASGLFASQAEHLLFAAVRGCESEGEVRTRGDAAGGLVGRLDVGAVVDGSAAGAALSQNGDYVGGIVGRASGTLSNCWARCELEGRRYVGGIAGLGADLLGCRAWPHIARAAEYAGAVAGWSEGTVQGNLYVDSRPDGVDGVSRIGQAEPVSESAFLALGGLPASFGTVTLRFVVEGVTVETRTLPFGGAAGDAPAVPERGRAYWVWQDFDGGAVYADREVTGFYRTPDSTLATGGAVPDFLVEGEFGLGQRLEVSPVTLAGEDGWTLTVPDYAGALTVRMRSAGGVKLYTPADGGWRELDAVQDGQYLVFTLPNGGTVVSRSFREPPWHLIAAGSGTGLIALLLLIRALSRRGGKRKPRARTEHTPAS